jgi:hypothetical protein
MMMIIVVWGVVVLDGFTHDAQQQECGPECCVVESYASILCCEKMKGVY